MAVTSETATSGLLHPVKVQRIVLRRTGFENTASKPSAVRLMTALSATMSQTSLCFSASNQSIGRSRDSSPIGSQRSLNESFFCELAVAKTSRKCAPEAMSATISAFRRSGPLPVKTVLPSSATATKRPRSASAAPETGTMRKRR